VFDYDLRAKFHTPNSSRLLVIAKKAKLKDIFMAATKKLP
jgi:hypothetical protein